MGQAAWQAWRGAIADPPTASPVRFFLQACEFMEPQLCPVNSLESQAAGNAQPPSLLLPKPSQLYNQMPPIPSSEAGLIAKHIPSSAPWLREQLPLPGMFPSLPV